MFGVRIIFPAKKTLNSNCGGEDRGANSKKYYALDKKVRRFFPGIIHEQEDFFFFFLAKIKLT